MGHRPAPRVLIVEDSTLIAMDLELDKATAGHSFAELAMPFQKSLAALSDRELDALARRPRTKANR